jgi:uncharacterized protein (DUF433 family)
MNTVQEAEKLLREMTRAEKAQLLQRIVQDLGDAFPGIESRPDICGGEPCIVRTRIPVWVLVRAKQMGVNEADLLRSYPTLRAEDLTNAWAYFRVYRNEIEQQIRENEDSVSGTANTIGEGRIENEVPSIDRAG